MKGTPTFIISPSELEVPRRRQVIQVAFLLLSNHFINQNFSQTRNMME